MLRPLKIKISDIYIPVKFRDTLDAEKVQVLAASIAEEGLKTPILVREDKERFEIGRAHV